MNKQSSDKYAQHVIGVGGIVIRNNRVLMVKLNYGHLTGRWVLPGGHVDLEENLDAAVEREVFEETGIKARARGVVAVRSLLRSDARVEVYIVFLMDYLTGEPTRCPEENDAVKYFTQEEVIKNQNATPLARAIVSEVLGGSYRLLSLQKDFPLNDPSYRFFI